MKNNVEKRAFDIDGMDFLFGEDQSKENVKSNDNGAIEVPLSELHEFRNHPFKVLDDEKMQETMESIKEHGVLYPGIVRPLDEGGYEIIAGHRRKRACELLGLKTMPVLVCDYDDDKAAIIMVDTNIQREEILPSEKAKAYRMKYEALLHQGKRTDLLEDQENQCTADQVGELAGDSGRTVQRYRRLAYLNDTLLTLVDEKKLTFNAGILLAYLTDEEQLLICTLYEKECILPNVDQAREIKDFHEKDKLTQENFLKIMKKQEDFTFPSITLKKNTLQSYFPPRTSKEDMENVILSLLAEWKSKTEVGEKE